MRLSTGLQLSDELTNNALEEMMLAAMRLKTSQDKIPALYVDREIAELHLRVFLEDVIGSQEAIRARGGRLT